MIVKLFIQTSARTDIIDQFRHYTGLNLPHIAEKFRCNVEKSISDILATPMAGSPCYSENPRLSGLRKWPVAEFDRLRIYYLFSDDILRIIRILHERRNIRTILATQPIDKDEA